LLSETRQNGVIGWFVRHCASVVHSTQLPSVAQIGWLPLQCASDPHSAQIMVVGLQWGALPPPSGEHSVSVVHLTSQLLPTHN
jgi:hypothetical protein